MKKIIIAGLLLYTAASCTKEEDTDPLYNNLNDVEVYMEDIGND